MLKRVSAFILCLVLLAGLLPASARAAGGREGPESAFGCSDRETAHAGVCWYVDSLGEGCVMAARLETASPGCAGQTEPEIVTERLTNFPVDQLLYWQGSLLAAAGEKLLTLDPETGAVLDTSCFPEPLERFAVNGAGLYVLTGGRLLDPTGETLRAGVEDFWLEDAQTLCYMPNRETVVTRSLTDGRETLAPNRASTLEGTEDRTDGDGIQSMGLQSLKQKFPAGKYWNHMPYRGTGMSYNNQDGWTNLPCSKHNNSCGTSQQTCNGYAPDGVELAYQCWGFADKLGHDATGRDPQNFPASGWSKLWYASALNNLKAGDIVRFNKYGNSAYAHSIYVTAVSGNTVTYADCNYDGTCVIRWDQTISKSTLKSWFVFMRSAPAPLQKENPCRLSVEFSLDGTPTDSAAGWVRFEVRINGALYRSEASSLQGEFPKGTAYELRSISPAVGIMLDESCPETVSGTLSADTKLTLELDHYYTDSQGRRVKTKLRDLPAPGKWSYDPICWALEHKIAGGLSVTSFGPGKACTRAQVMSFLWTMSGRPEPEEGELSFTDVEPGDYFYKPVRWALQKGITAGKSALRFKPGDVCTRGEVVTFLWRLAGQPVPAVLEQSEGAENLSPFTDVSPDHYYYHPVLWALERQLTAGTSADSFSPGKDCTRAEILAFLYRFSQG